MSITLGQVCPIPMVFIIFQPQSMFTRFKYLLKLDVGNCPSPCNKHSSFYFLDQYPAGESQELPSNFFIFKIGQFCYFFAELLIFFQEHLQSDIIY